MAREVVELHISNKLIGYSVFCNTIDKLITSNVFETYDEAEKFIDEWELSFAHTN